MAKDKDKEFDFLNPDAQSSPSSSNDEDNMVLDLNDVDESAPTYAVLPVGIYDAVVENAEFGPSSNNNPMISWTFKIIDPQYEGRFLFYHTTLHTDQGRARLKRMLLRLYTDLDLSKFNPRKFCDEGEGLGMPCRVKVKIGRYQGEKRNNVTDVLAAAEEGSFMDD